MKPFYKISVILILTLGAVAVSEAKNQQTENDADIIEIRGKVIDATTSEALITASISLFNSNLSTVSNTEGRFAFKIPQNTSTGSLLVSFLGYVPKQIALSDLKTNRTNIIRLEPHVVQLSEVDIFPSDPTIIINSVLNNIEQNYPTEDLVMTSFYRETIKKRNHYVALAEAVVEIRKPSSLSTRSEQARILKGRKGVNVSKMDTLIFKLQGGTHSMLALDLIKYPYSILSPDIQDCYIYTYRNITSIDGEPHIVLAFKQRDFIDEPMFYGTLFIHAKTMAIAFASYSLNVDDKVKSSNIFIRKKPANCRIYPEYANYTVNYRHIDDKWYFSHAQGDIKFNINWKKRLFNSSYTTSSEMAVTDFKVRKIKAYKGNERLNPSAVMNEAIEGFYDPNFWGKYNVIEPEKSINSAIKKIAKNIEKIN